MRKSGILLHITSLDSPYGIGTIGKSAFDFIDFLNRSKVKCWQILPIGHTSFGDSPYQTFSAFAGNPYMIDLDALVTEGLLTTEEVLPFKVNVGKVDYENLYNTRFSLFSKAFTRFFKIHKNKEYEDFKDKNSYWLDDYALFMTLKNKYHGAPWFMWDDEYKFRNEQALTEFSLFHNEKIEYWKFIQYEFFKQWDKLKKYASKNDIEIIGDLPIYVAYDSVDFWAEPTNFLVKDDLTLDVVAGVPPDYFSQDGQLWGNPIYDYKKMEKDNYTWWIRRIDKAFSLFDYVRIDHFRGFEAYYAIDAKAKNARDGRWHKGPGIALFEEIRRQLGDKKIIAEDLGLLTKEVYELLEATGFPGMKILQFAFDPYNDNPYLPHNTIKNSIYYTGTHDNMTLREWIESLEGLQKDYVYEYCNVNKNEKDADDKLLDALIRIALGTSSDMCIIPLTDYLKLGSKGRMNTPSKAYGNWTFRVTEPLTEELSEYIYKLNKIYKRI